MTSSKRPKLRSLQIDDGMIVLDRSLAIMSCNAAAKVMLKADFKPGDSFSLERYLQGDDLEKAVKVLQSAIDQGQTGVGVSAGLACSDQPDASCRYSIYPLYAAEGKIIGATICFQIITPLLATETLDHIQAPADRTPHVERRTILEALPEGVFTINTKWRIVSFNRTAEKITGYQRSEVTGRHCWDIFRSDLCELGCPLSTALETGQMSVDQDIRMINKGGARQTILVNAGVLRDHHGHIIGAVETFRPLTGDTLTPPGIDQRHSFADIIGKSKAMKRLFRLLPDVAASEANVLIYGESGTGKELIAKTLHHHSPRANNPFVAVNCSALAESLLESELFGHDKSAFTGATESKAGRFERAKGGTLFLDEIGELKPELQIKLLRVLEQREFERVGGTQTLPMTARIISATNRDLRQAIQSGRFREDFYYRLRTVPLNIPPLRERLEDIPLLASFFIRQFNQRYKKRVRSVDAEVMRFFMQYHWPGNVRELERTLEHAFVFVKGPVILPRNLPDKEEFCHPSPERPPEILPAPNGCSKQTILWALSQTDGNRNQTAKLLGMSRTSLWRRMKALDLI